MDGRGGCCIARYAGGAYDAASKVDRIMLRFRPIAPKPASAGGFVSAGVVPDTCQRSTVSSPVRKKRRNVKEGESDSRTNKRFGGRKRKPSPEVAAFGGGEAVMKTLPLLPETPDVKESVGGDRFRLQLSDVGGRVPPGVDHVMEDAAVAAAPGRSMVVESWVRVERVTDRWVLDSYGYGVVLGRTDVEKVMCLDLDTCPGFISDGFNNVRWINAAYRRMASADEEVVVRVVVEEGLALPAEWTAFTCRVRVVTCGKEKGSLSSSTLPCDVWRMDSGGFAWRLDTKAALSLGW